MVIVTTIGTNTEGTRTTHGRATMTDIAPAMTAFILAVHARKEISVASSTDLIPRFARAMILMCVIEIFTDTEGKEGRGPDLWLARYTISPTVGALIHPGHSVINNHGTGFPTFIDEQ